MFFLPDHRPLLIMVRGISGSGKTTLAKSIQEDILVETRRVPNIWEADQFHYVNGEYDFQVHRLAWSHDCCFAGVKDDLSKELITILSNTCTTWKEVKRYAELADAYNAQLSVVEPITEWAFDPEVCFNKNVHGVPLSTIKKQKERWFDIQCMTYRPGELKELYED